MTEDASVVPLVTENRGEITGHAVYVDDKKSRSELECFIYNVNSTKCCNKYGY